MEQKDRKQIMQNLKLLTEPGIIDYAKIEPYLLIKKIFTKAMIDDINAEKTHTGQVHKLLVDLCTRGPYAFKAFIGILLETRQVEAIKILSPNLEINDNNEVDSRRGNSVVEAEATQLSTVKLATEWIEGEECYRMSSDPRGLCLIINNEDFGGLKLKREGSEQDGIMANKVFEDLGYDIQTELNISAHEMEVVLSDFAKRVEHSDLDSCVVIIMSHGDKGIVYGSDCDPVSLEAIYHLFNNQNCRGFIGNPKMFFIQTCRGDVFDVGVSKPIPNFRPVMRDGPVPICQGAQLLNKIPTWTDMLISYSVVKGYVSNRDGILGTWYIQTLLDVLMRRAWNTDLYTILQEVDKQVGKIVNDLGEKQSPELVLRGFSKKLYFNPGLHK